MDNFHIRELSIHDFDKGILELYGQFFTIDVETIDIYAFESFVTNICSPEHVIFVIEHDGKIVATSTCLLETKLIHNFGKVCHIEDVVISTLYRGRGLGRMIIDKCILYAQERNCYKVILDCARDNVPFYEKCGFTANGHMMSRYF